MKKTVVAIFFFLIFTLSFFSLRSQSTTPQTYDPIKYFYHGVGGTFLADVYMGPYREYDNGNGNYSYARIFSISMLSISYQLKADMYHFSDDITASAHAYPTFGLALGGSKGTVGFGAVDVPVMLGFDFGKGATNYSEKSVGTFLLAGVEYTRTPLIINPIHIKNGPNVDWANFCMSGGVRFSAGFIETSELNLKVGVGFNKTISKNPNFVPYPAGIVSVRLSWVAFIE